MRFPLGRSLQALPLLLLLLIPGTALTQPEDPCPLPDKLPPLDNRDGYQVLFEEPPIHPMELSSNGRELWVASIPDASVSVFAINDAGELTLIREIGVCLGPVTVRYRPALETPHPNEAEGSDSEAEVWVVCHSSNSVAVINARTRRLVETIRVPTEPADLVFNDDYSTAYVSASSSNQIARIDAASRTLLTPTIEATSEMPPGLGLFPHIEEPRSLLLDGDSLYALSFKSGNGTITDQSDLDGDGDMFDIVNMWTIFPPTIPPPDRDVLVFDVTNPSQPGANALWRTGTFNFDLVLGPGDDLYVSTVDLFNDLREHKFDYKLNGFSAHRINYGPPSATGLPPTPTTAIDLNPPNGNIHAGLPATYRCAVPTELAFLADGSRLFVACQDSANSAVIDTTVTGSEQVIAQLAASGFGPRGVVLHESRNRAYVYNRGDNTIDAFELPVTAGSTATPVQTVSAGFDITPSNVIAGRRLFLDASNSVDRLGNCNTCHMDGSADGLAWDLADFTGDLPAAPVVRDDNNVKMTMDLRGIEETPPFHWQGNRDDLVDFNAAFSGLLGGQLLTAQEFSNFQDFVFRLSYPPNPKQNAERLYSPDAVSGFGCFTLLPAHTVSADTTEYPPAGPPTFDVSCNDCHSMAGASGTNNQVNNDVAGLAAGDATQLRGLFDKESDIVFYGAVPLPASGFGFLNAGTVFSVANFISLFNFNSTQAAQTNTFVTELDSGMAPSTAFAWTLNAASAGPVGTVPAVPVLSYQIPQAIAGHSDLVVRGWLKLSGTPTPVGMLYDRRSGLFVTNISGFGPFTFSQLVNMVRFLPGALTFLGTPVDSGYRLGLDRDMDQLLDGDEPGLGTSAANPDSDGDGYPDGYEVRLGSDPASSGSLPPVETIAPVIGGEILRWTNSQVAKISWNTNEEADSRVDVIPSGGSTPVWSGFEPQMKRRHTMVVRNLDPGVKSYDLVIRGADPVGNVGTSTLLTGTNGPTSQAHLFNSVHIRQTTLTAVGITGTGQQLLKVDFTVVDENDQPISGATVTARLIEWVPGSGTNAIQTGTTGPSNAAGLATVTLTSSLPAGSGFTAEAMADRSTLVTDPTTNRHYFHPLDGEFNYWAQLTGL
jgi:DNA-binding beta-propeller fold protein YncE